MRYRPEIDGLRAIAVLIVIAYHAGFPGFSGGYVGVDVFFVISGYLITGILTEDLARDRFSLLHFYERRARRILPALFFVMFLCIPPAWLWMDPYELKEFSQSIFATSLFSSNIFFFLKSSYFDVSSELKPLLHTWSLAVEEQFYLVYPLFLWLVWRKTSNFLSRAIGLVLVTSLALAEYASTANPGWNFYMPFTRAWELMVGAQCAIFLRSNTMRANQFWPALGLAAIFGSAFLFDDLTRFPSMYALAPVIGTALIILYGSKDSYIDRLLSTRILVGIGLVSYSAYLWHQPVFAFMRLRSAEQPGPGYFLAASVGSLLLAVFSYYIVEQPFRARSTRFLGRRATIFSLSALGIVLLCGFGYLGHVEQGFPSRNEFYSRLAQNFGLSAACDGNDLSDPKCRTSEDVRAVIWGDSYAMHIVRALEIVEANAGLAQATLSACPPIVGYRDAQRKSRKVSCEEYNEHILHGLVRDDGTIERVYLSSTFTKLINNDAAATQSLFVDTIESIKAAGLEVVIVGPSPSATFDVSKCLKNKARSDNKWNDCDYAATQINQNYAAKIQVLEKISTDTDTRFIDLQNVICPDDTCRASIDGKIIYRDAGHFSIESAPIVARAFQND